MFPTRQYTRFLLLACPLLLHAASVTVTPTVTSAGGLFHYNYSVANTSATDLSDIEITVATGAGTLQNLMAPSGFSAFFDSGLGVVDFVEDARLFAGQSTTGGFTFDSLLRPAASGFTAVGLDANQNAVNFSGPTLAPVGAPAAVPEPAAPALVAIGLGFVLLVSRLLS